MARVTYVKRAQQRYETKPVIDPATGKQKVVPVLRKDGSPKMTKSKAGRPGRPVVMRVTEADKSRPKPNYHCEKCGTEITVGSPYKWIKPKSGPYGGRMRVRCMTCPNWRPSETTSSAALSVLYGAQEAADDALGDWDANDGADALREILTNLAEGVREAAEVYEESASNMEDGFGHETSLSAELREKAEALNSAADDIEGNADDIEDFDEDEATQEAESEVDQVDEEAIRAEIVADWDDIEDDHEHTVVCGTSGAEHYLCTYNEREASIAEAIEGAKAEREAEVSSAVEEKREEWADEQRSKVEDAISQAEAY